jgi:formylglycine-generating enzyme required for sulfatase activity
MALAIKFDLRFGSQRITQLTDLRDNFSADILPHFQAGRLSKWLKSRGLTELSAGVDAVDKSGTELQQLVGICRVLGLDDDEEVLQYLLDDRAPVQAAAVPTEATAVVPTETIVQPIAPIQPTQRNPQPGDILCAGSGFPALVVLRGGDFQMGEVLLLNAIRTLFLSALHPPTSGPQQIAGFDTHPKHAVHITSFAMGKYPVTQGQWKKVMGSNPSYFSSGGDQCPVEKVSWDDAQAFIQKLNQQTGHSYRLPSEAEWEYACRAGSTGKWCFGDDEDQLKHYAWYEDNSGGKTHPVGEKKANAFGLHDMHGNVWEWCEDEWHDNYQGAPSDGRAWVDGKGSERLLRGGARDSGAGSARSAQRLNNRPDGHFINLGFRLARTVP